jgi:hypothetical protein
MYLAFAQQAEQVNYLLPLPPGSELPAVPAGGVKGNVDASQVKGVRVLPHMVQAALNASVYAFVRVTNRRNIYRIPLQ